jgi:hypothetical protein
MTRNSRLLFSLLLIWMLSACAGQNSPPVEDYSALRIQKEQEVYSALLGADDSSYIVILSETTYYETELEDLPKEIPSLSKVTVTDYELRNQQSVKFPASLNINKQYALIDRTELDSLLAKYDWEKFNQKYQNANAVYALSRVGFDPEFKQALVYMEYSCGGECGLGSLYFLAYDGKNWTIQKQYDLWVS